MKKANFIVLGLFLLLSACAQKVHDVDTKVSENFATQYKTYQWVADKKKRLVPEAAQELVKMTDKLLESKGYRKEASSPDFLLSFDISTLKNKTDVSKTSGVADYGPGISCSGGNCQSTNKKVVVQDTSVSINMLVQLELKAQDATSKEVLWTTNSQIDITETSDANSTDRQVDITKLKKVIDSAVKKMTKGVPPRK
jgi:hypothetical protein